MNILMFVHIAGGSLALLSGTFAVAAPKGGRLHARAGSWFVISMLVLGATATILARLQTDPDLGLGGILTCYFVLTSWVTARRRDGAIGRFEIAACAVVLGGAPLIAWAGLTGAASTPAGPGPLFAFAALCLLAALLDLNAILRKKLTPTQRLSRHLWRMCVAFFIATGSFFIGQQDVMPSAVRGSPVLWLLGFAPMAVMLLWLWRLQLSKSVEHFQRRSRSGSTHPRRASFEKSRSGL